MFFGVIEAIADVVKIRYIQTTLDGESFYVLVSVNVATGLVAKPVCLYGARQYRFHQAVEKLVLACEMS